MLKEVFLNHHKVKPGAVILEDWDVFSKGIVGVTSDGRIIYDFDRTAVALAESFAGSSLESIDDESRKEYLDEAFEWLDYNTFSFLASVPEDVRPVFVAEDAEYEEEAEPEITIYSCQAIDELEHEIA